MDKVEYQMHNAISTTSVNMIAVEPKHSPFVTPDGDIPMIAGKLCIFSAFFYFVLFYFFNIMTALMWTFKYYHWTVHGGLGGTPYPRRIQVVTGCCRSYKSSLSDWQATRIVSVSSSAWVFLYSYAFICSHRCSWLERSQVLLVRSWLVDRCPQVLIVMA